jgi:hypothetical protein
MSKLAENIRSPHAQIAATAGASILVLAIASRWLVPQPIGYLSHAFPPFLAVIYEAVSSKRPQSRLCKSWYWVVAIAAATAAVIALHMV